MIEVRPIPTDAERSAHRLFCDEVTAALVDLAGHYGLDATDVRSLVEPCRIEGHQVAGIIGFAGPGLGGALAVRVASTVARSCLPVAAVGAGSDTHALGDWIAELANQLLGRAKNKLVRYQQGFHVTPPTFGAADDLAVLGCDPARTSWLAVITPAGPLLVMVELHTSPDFVFTPVADGTVARTEGELLIF